MGFVLVAKAASAQIGPTDGVPIRTSRYTLDLYQGPVLAGARVVGLAGAYAPIAEGVAGFAYNPASVAHRVPWSVDWFDWDVDGGFTLPGSVVNTDFDNNGDTTFASSTDYFLTAGGSLKFGPFAVGATFDINRYGFLAEGGKRSTLDVNITEGLLVLGYAFARGQLVAGVGLGVNNAQVVDVGANAADKNAESEVASVTGGSLRLGVLWAPHHLPLRGSLAVRLAPPQSFNTDAPPTGIQPDAEGNYTLPDPITGKLRYLPLSINLPTEIHAGLAVQLFRRMNLPWKNPKRDDAALAPKVEREIAEARKKRREEADRRLGEARANGKDIDEVSRAIRAAEAQAKRDEAKKLEDARKADRRRRRLPYHALSRPKLLISAAVKMTAPTPNAVGVESFLEQIVERSGERWSISPRLGLEGEVVPRWLVLRGGTYYEPTRFRMGTPRVHGTLGLDVKLPFSTELWGLFDEKTSFRVGGALDYTARYFGWGVSAGIWR